MKDMKMTKEDRKAREGSMKAEPMGGEYGYSLRITLDDAQLAKLGMKTLPKVGAKLKLDALVSVIAVRQSERAGGSGDRSVELQIQKMDLGKAGPTSAEEAVSDAVDEASED